MLRLQNIVKEYDGGANLVRALRGVSLEFRKNEFVSILGPSGCGKTTLLNIVGGLDRYTSGELSINGISTTQYKDVDWDIYRNNSIGFVFQSYNLISHQTVFANVELAMTLAGTSRAERRERVLAVLEKVGLGDQVDKKPTQMSGGQMQRVAIARALVNNPEILLADEPTGALDSQNSLQIMELLKEIARDRLVIMVTHNAELAQQYSTRIIRLVDGRVTDDTAPYDSQARAAQLPKGKRKKISMSFSTALSLSFKNLLTKKARTTLASVAGSIGIIGIALIMSLSNGMQTYVNNIERDSLSTFPLELTRQSLDTAAIVEMMMSQGDGNVDHELDRIYPSNILTEMLQTMATSTRINDLRAFKAHLEGDDRAAFEAATSAIEYGYGVDPQVYLPDTAKWESPINPSTVMQNLNGGGAQNESFGGGMMGMGSIWTQLLGNDQLLDAQYDIVAGQWPKARDELVLVVDKNNQISDLMLYALGLLDATELEQLIAHASRGEEYQPAGMDKTFNYDELLAVRYKLLLNTDYYAKQGGVWVDMRTDAQFMKTAIEQGIELKIVGIIRPDASVTATAINGAIGYTPALMDYLTGAIQQTDIAKQQKANPEINVFTGLPFAQEALSAQIIREQIRTMIQAGYPLPEGMPGGMTGEDFLAFLDTQPDEVVMSFYLENMADESAKPTTYEQNCQLLGLVDKDTPSVIRLYPKDFESKKQLIALIADYNKGHQDASREDKVINYSDLVGTFTSSFSKVIDIIAYILMAFVSISLVVSSIMIAIITYTSVLERTKEIGILRSIGGSKKDITRVFNAETIIIGFAAGAIGVIVTMLLNIPINMIIKMLTSEVGVSAQLPWYGAAGLIIISVLLTVVAGLVPSKMAAKKDPVEALRTE